MNCKFRCAIFTDTLCRGGVARVFVAVLVSALLQGCSGLFFAPMKQQVLTPDRIGLAYRDVNLHTADHLQLHAWFLPASVPAKGRVLYLHGNGENISTHLASVYWLPEAGYEVLLLDYRGYGQSPGEPAIPDVLHDLDAALGWLQANTAAGLPLTVFGQSLGGSLAYQWVSLRQPPAVTAVIYDSVFDSYPAMVRKVLQEAWLTWPFSYPVSWFFSAANDPLRFAAQQPAIPRLFVHSRDDVVVPLASAKRLYDANAHCACFIEGQGLHIGLVQQQAGRAVIAAFLADPQGQVQQCGAVQQLLGSAAPVYLPLPPIRPPQRNPQAGQ